MFSKNNFSMLTRRSLDRQSNYSLRKLSVGLASIATISFLTFGQSITVQAEEEPTIPTVKETSSTINPEIHAEPLESPPIIEEQSSDEIANELNQIMQASEDLGESEKSTIQIEEGDFGSLALEHTKELSEEIGQREAGSAQEKEAANYIHKELTNMNYHTEFQEFNFTSRDSDQIKTSQNIIAVKKDHNPRTVIVGAHYDSVTTPGSLGAADNASGDGVMLETAQRLKDVDLGYTLTFIAFGAEEVGLKGSEYYVSQLSQKEKDNIIAMINLDTLLGGDYMYVYSGADENTWVRDLVFDLNETYFDFPIYTNPGLNPDYPAGTTGDWSDHAPFRKTGIPVAYFESTNWEVGALDGYDQTEKYGPIMHSNRDNLSFLQENMPGHVEERLSTFTTLLQATLLNITDPLDEAVNDKETDGGQTIVEDINDDSSIEFPTIRPDPGLNRAINKSLSKQAIQPRLVASKTSNNKDNLEHRIANQSQQLPDTASSMWIIGLSGCLFLMTGLSIHEKRDQ